MQGNSHVSDVSRLYDEIAENGPYGTLAPHNRGGRKSRYVAEVFDAALLPILAKNAQQDDVLLDYGCGTGIFSVSAARHVGKVVAVDVSGSMLEWGKKLNAGRFDIDWLLTDGLSIPLPDQSVHWVVARESLCYVPADRLDSVVAETFRVLKPGGRFLWLDQVSDNPDYLSHAGAPLLEKRPISVLVESATMSGFVHESSHCVREPRFPWIYPVWAGLVPVSWFPTLARWEVAFLQRHGRTHGRRWKDALMQFRRPK